MINLNTKMQIKFIIVSLFLSDINHGYLASMMCANSTSVILVININSILRKTPRTCKTIHVT